MRLCVGSCTVRVGLVHRSCGACTVRVGSCTVRVGLVRVRAECHGAHGGGAGARAHGLGSARSTREECGGAAVRGAAVRWCGGAVAAAVRRCGGADVPAAARRWPSLRRRLRREPPVEEPLAQPRLDVDGRRARPHRCPERGCTCEWQIYLQPARLGFEPCAAYPRRWPCRSARTVGRATCRWRRAGDRGARGRWRRPARSRSA